MSGKVTSAQAEALLYLWGWERAYQNMPPGHRGSPWRELSETNHRMSTWTALRDAGLAQVRKVRGVMCGRIRKAGALAIGDYIGCSQDTYDFLERALGPGPVWTIGTAGVVSP